MRLTSLLLLLLTAIVHNSSSSSGSGDRGKSASTVTAASTRDTTASVPFSTTAVPLHQQVPVSSNVKTGTVTSPPAKELDEGRSSTSSSTSATVAGEIIQVAGKGKNITAAHKHSRNGNLPINIDRLLRSPAAANGLQNKHIQPRNAIRLERKDLQKQQQRLAKQQRSLKLTKRSSDSDSPFLARSPLTHSLFNFLQSPAPLHSNAGKSSFRELRKANGQFGREASHSSVNSLPHRPSHGYFSSPLLSDTTSDNEQDFEHSSPDASVRLESLNDAKTDDSLTDTTDADGNADSVTSDFLGQIQLAVLRKLEAQLMNELNRQEEKQQLQQESSKLASELLRSQANVGEYGTESRDDASDNLLYALNGETGAKNGNPVPVTDNERMNPHDTLARPSLYAYDAHEEADDSSPPAGDDYPRNSGTNIFLDPHQFAQLIASNGEPRDVNFLPQDTTNNLMDTSTLVDKYGERGHSAHRSTIASDDKSIKVKQDGLTKQQQEPSMDSRSINIPSDVARHEPSSVFSQRNVERTVKQYDPQVASLSSPSTTHDDLSNLIARIAGDSVFASKNEQEQMDQLISSLSRADSVKKGRKNNSLGNKLHAPAVDSVLVNGHLLQEKRSPSHSVTKANDDADDDTLALLATGDADEDTRKQESQSVQNDLDAFNGANQLFYPKSLDSEARVSELNPPGYFSLDDYNTYFSNVLGNAIASHSPSLSLKSDDASDGDEESDLLDLLQYLRGTDGDAVDEESYLSTAIGVEGTPGFTLTDSPQGASNQLLTRKSYSFSRPQSEDDEALAIVGNSDPQDFYLNNAIDRLFAAGSNSVKRNQVEEIKRLFTGSKRVDIKKPGPKLDWAEKASDSSDGEDKVESKKAEGPFFRSSSGGITRQLSGRLQHQQKAAKLRSNDSPGQDENEEDSKRDETIVFISLVVILVSITLILLTSVVYIARRHQLLRRKILHLLGRLDMSEPADDYKDLCRQRMAKKSSEVPVNPDIAARASGDTSAAAATGPSASTSAPSAGQSRKKKTSASSSSEGSTVGASGRSSTSSWCEEPASCNMDISTGHMILSYMEDHLKNKDRLDREWKALLAYEADTCFTIAGQLAQNCKKNRYPDILPYDHSRVILNDSCNSCKSDYINASTIIDHDPRNPAYIATQGPLANTVGDFWQMVWEQGSHTIVMLTRLMESGNQLCHRYWPEEGSCKYGSFEVHLVSEHIWCEDYLVRSLFVKNLTTNETRTVTQFHFLSWPEKSVPSTIKAILDFRRKANKSFKGKSCPTVVHCSDGCGRTGTYILIDMVLTRMTKGVKEIDIAATLEHIRDQRMSMVKSKVQFEFVLKAVAEEVTAILRSLQNSNH